MANRNAGPMPKGPMGPGGPGRRPPMGGKAMKLDKKSRLWFASYLCGFLCVYWKHGKNRGCPGIDFKGFSRARAVDGLWMQSDYQ